MEDVPESLRGRLLSKLTNGVFDAGSFFGINKKQLVDTTGGLELLFTQHEPLQPFQDIFLVDHAWTFDDAGNHESLVKTLLENPSLLRRLETMLGMDNEHVNDAAAGAEDEVVVQPDEEIIALVMDSVQAEGVAVVDRARVIRALIDNNNEIVNAICSLTSPDGEEVLNSVISQIASSLDTSSSSGPSPEQRADRVVSQMWRLVNTYSISYLQQPRSSGSSSSSSRSNNNNTEDPVLYRSNSWYIMDEVGSSINHSSSSPPTVKCVPFLFTDPTTNTTTPYSVFWPITKLEYLDAATCDWAVAFGIKDGGGGGADENVADIAAARNRSAYIHALGWLDNSAEEGEGVEEDDEKMAAAAALDFPKSSSAAFNLKTQLAQLVAFYMYHADRLNSSSSSTSPMSFTVEALDGDGQDRKIGLLTTLPFTTKNFMQVVKMRDLLGAEESSSSTTTTTSSVSDGGGSGLIVQCTALTESVKR